MMPLLLSHQSIGPNTTTTHLDLAMIPNLPGREWKRWKERLGVFCTGCTGQAWCPACSWYSSPVAGTVQTLRPARKGRKGVDRIIGEIRCKDLGFRISSSKKSNLQCQKCHIRWKYCERQRKVMKKGGVNTDRSQGQGHDGESDHRCTVTIPDCLARRSL